MNGIQPENCKIFSVKMGENRCDNGITPCLHAVVMDSCQICETCNTRLFLTPKSLNMGPFFVKITKIFWARNASPENFQKIPKHGSIF